MKISDKLPQFIQKKTLFIIAGLQACRFYFGNNGEITEIGSFEISKPEYTDREGWFKKQKGGQLLGSGSVYEPKDLYVKDKFVHRVCAMAEKFITERNIKSIYLFSPAKTISEIQKKVSHVLISRALIEKYILIKARQRLTASGPKRKPKGPKKANPPSTARKTASG